jgi:hypothetical protein
MNLTESRNVTGTADADGWWLERDGSQISVTVEPANEQFKVTFENNDDGFSIQCSHADFRKSGAADFLPLGKPKVFAGSLADFKDDQVIMILAKAVIEPYLYMDYDDLCAVIKERWEELDEESWKSRKIA